MNISVSQIPELLKVRICSRFNSRGRTTLLMPCPAQNRRALEYIASGAVPVADLITDRLPLEQFADGVQAVIGGTAIKVTIEP